MASPAPQFIDPKILVGIKNLMVRARTVVEGALVGEHISPFRGGSVEFAQHRAYCPGDELRYIDWRLFARTDHYHVKQFDVTTNLRAYMLLDASGSMAYPTDGPVTKFTYGSLLASALAYIFVQQSDAVSVALNGDDGVRYLPPRSQVGYLQQILDVMASHVPQGDQDVLSLLQFAEERVVRRSLIVVFSDFFVALEDLMPKIRILQRRGHDLMVFQILHPDEISFPFHRFYRFLSMEGAESVTADSQNMKKWYLDAFGAHQSALAEAMRQSGVDFQSVRTDEAPDRILARHLNGPLRAKKLRKPY